MKILPVLFIYSLPIYLSQCHIHSKFWFIRKDTWLSTKPNIATYNPILIRRSLPVLFIGYLSKWPLPKSNTEVQHWHYKRFILLYISNLHSTKESSSQNRSWTVNVRGGLSLHTHQLPAMALKAKSTPDNHTTDFRFLSYSSGLYSITQSLQDSRLPIPRSNGGS